MAAFENHMAIFHFISTYIPNTMAGTSHSTPTSEELTSIPRPLQNLCTEYQNTQARSTDMEKQLTSIQQELQNLGEGYHKPLEVVGKLFLELQESTVRILGLIPKHK